MGDTCCGDDTTCKKENCTGDCSCKKDDTQKDGCCSDTGTCGCAGDATPLDLSAAQIKKINEILGDIDDEDLETGNYDLTEEQAEELNSILFGKKS